MPEKIGDYIHIPVPGEAGKHEGHARRTFTLSKKKGIKALRCVVDGKLTTYMFNTKSPWNWTMDRAQAWVKKHKKSSFASLAEDGKAIFEHFDEKGALVEVVAQEQLVKEVEKGRMDFEKEMREDRIIFLFDRISDWTAEDICKRLLIYDKLDSEKPVKLFLSSYGGGVYASFAITDMMEYVKCPVETIGIGKIMSGGLLIFMAGSMRHISQTASILSHRFSTMKVGNQAQLKADQVEDDLVHKRMIDHYVKFSNLEDKKEVETKLLREVNTWLTPEQALEFELADDYFDKDWTEGEEGATEENDKQNAVYNCQCIKCGYSITTTKHCNTLKCPKCGGQMRRKERPGPGQEAVLGESYKHKLGGYGYISDGAPEANYSSPKSEFGYYPSVSRLSEIYFFLDSLAESQSESDSGILKKIKGVLKHWTGQEFPVPQDYWIPDEEENASELHEMFSLLKRLDDSEAQEMLREMEGILARIVQGDCFYPRLYSSVEEGVRDVKSDFLLESVTVDWIEENPQKPFKFRGKAVKVDRVNDNARRYKKGITERALKETYRLGEKGKVLTVMDGHPKKGDTAVTPVVGKVVFGGLDVDGWMPYEATISDTSRGLDIQKLLRDKCIGDVSLRSRGRTSAAKMEAGQVVEDVVDLHFKGLDLVTQGSEEGAGVDAILNAYWNGIELLEAIGGSKVLPTNLEGSWDGDAAVKRMRKLAGGPDKEDMNWTAYRKGFVRYDAKDQENFGSYKLPFADSIGGKLTAVWGGINAAMGVVNGAHGGIDIPLKEKKSAYNFLVTYYKRMNKTPPAFRGEMGGEFAMGTTLEELKKDCPELVEAIRTEEKDKLHKDIDKTKGELKEVKEAKEKLDGDLETAKKDLKEAKEDKGDKSEAEKKLEKKIEDLEEKVKDYGEKVIKLEAEKKLRDSKAVYSAKLKESGMTEDMAEGLEELCLGKKPEDMDKIIEARVALVKKLKTTEPIGLTEKKEGDELTEDQKKVKKEKTEDEVRSSFDGSKKE